ncbi:VTT domain-containing protein [Pelagibacteraceae bacterium]|jgi:membrane protein YqaA with SNARE-associated domain|nr:VTT domain-containing protein [Pelagibacteraceae bacterium]
MIRNFYFSLKKYLLKKSSKFTKSRLAYPFIFVLCFLESIVFPFPQEVFMIPMMASDRDRIFKIAWFALLGSLLGAIAAYFIGMYLFESIGMYILNLYGLYETFTNFSNQVSEYGFLYVFVGGFTPVPFKIVTLSSGFIGINFLIFIAASIISRSIRFFLIGYIIWKFGEDIMKSFEKRLNTYLILFLIFISFIIIFLR